MSSAVSAVDAEASADVAQVAAITDLHVTFRRNGRDVHALRGVSLDIAPGEILGLVGESGSGKSVLGFTMLGLLPQARVQGSVTVTGTDMVTSDAKTRFCHMTETRDTNRLRSASYWLQQRHPPSRASMKTVK